MGQSETEPVVGGVLLAAGTSERFEGGNKLLAQIDGEPIVRRAARTLIESPVAGTVAVLGHDADAVAAALDDLDVETRHNDAYREGQHTSVAAGVAAARERGWDAVVFALGDMPFVDPDTVERVLDAYTDGEQTILAPEYEGQRGNPALFDATHFDALASVTGDRGGREIVEDSGTLVAVDDPGIHSDIDRPDDIQNLDNSK
jgi:molybdenum cofactor cytidylyltransferase